MPVIISHGSLLRACGLQKALELVFDGWGTRLLQAFSDAKLEWSLVLSTLAILGLFVCFSFYTLKNK